MPDGLEIGDPPPTPATRREPRIPSITYLVGALAGGNVLSAFLRMAGGLIVARVVMPDVLGLFNGIGLVQGYIRFVQAGVYNGLNRELPYFVGKGDRARVKQLAAAAQAWMLTAGFGVSAVLLALAAWHEFRGHLELASGLAANAVAVLVFFYSTMYLQATYRTGHDFARLSLANTLQNGLALALTFLAALWGFHGLCLRQSLALILSAAVLHYWRPIRVRPRWSLRELKHLCRIGLPIFAVGELYAYWVTLEGTLVLTYLHATGMGLYAMVAMAGSTMDLLPQAVAQVLYPRMAQEYGRTGDLVRVLRPTVKPMLFSAAGLVPLVGAGWFLAEPLTRWILPNYLAAVPAMRWSLLPSLVTCFLPIHNVYNVVRRQAIYAVAIAGGLAAYLGSLAWLTRNGVSLDCFPKAMLIGRSVFVLLGYLFLLVIVREFKSKSPPSPGGIATD